jgi:hypothetical protein
MIIKLNPQLTNTSIGDHHKFHNTWALLQNRNQYSRRCFEPRDSIRIIFDWELQDRRLATSAFPVRTEWTTS